jgi:hypothetical protein
MRHGSHGDACFRPFTDYRKREETKQPRGGWPTSPKEVVQETQRERIAGLAVDGTTYRYSRSSRATNAQAVC